MKQKILLALAMLLALAVSTTLTSCGDDNENSIVVNPENGNNNNGQQPPEDIIVTVDANGNADGGHHFDWIDNTNFYIDDVKYTAKDGNLVVTGYDPAFFQGEAKLITRLILVGRRMNVVEISEKAFYQCQVLKSVVIPRYVTSIGWWAFLYCTNLNSIIVGEGNKTYDSRNNCNAIIETATNNLILGCQNTNIPNSVTSIGGSAFYGCTGLTSVTIPNGVTSIGEGAFIDCSGLTSVTIPNGVTNIGYSAFPGCTGLTSVTIPNSVTSIGDFAFDGCTSLTSVTIKAKTPPTIDYFTFRNASNATLYVPIGCKTTYQSTYYWINFKEIIEIEMED